MKKIIAVLAFTIVSIISFAQLTKEPYLIYTGNYSTMKVMFQAEKPQIYIVSYGQTKEYEIGGAKISQQRKGEDENIFSYTFKYLKPNTKYYYKVSDKHHNNEYSSYFYSAKEPTDKKVYFTVVGNTSLNKTEGINGGVSKAILDFNNKAKKNYPFILHTGNFVEKGNSEKKWYSVLNNEDNKNVKKLLANLPIFVTKGKNEAKKWLLSKDKQLFRKYLKYKYLSNSCYYTFKYGHVKFIVLDQFADFSLDSEQFNWLRKELKNDKSNPKVILMHSALSKNKSIDVFELNALFTKNNVKVVFTSDAKGYLHSKIENVHYFSLGRKDVPTTKQNKKINKIKSINGNFFITVKYEGSNISISVLNTDLQIMDKYEIN